MCCVVTATWQDMSRTDCHIIAITPYLSGSFLTIASANAGILVNDNITRQDATFYVAATISYTEYGIVAWSKSRTDCMFVETNGGCGFTNRGLCPPITTK